MKQVENFKIALVDDDQFNLALTKNYLGTLGYADVKTFENGTSFLDNINERPEIVFLDHQMDGLNGFEVLKKIKRFDPNIFVVMLSGQEKINTAVDALKYGAFDYIIKGKEAFDRISNVMSRIATLKEMIEQSKPSFWKKLGSII